jgi:hypothetical protein
MSTILFITNISWFFYGPDTYCLISMQLVLSKTFENNNYIHQILISESYLMKITVLTVGPHL